VHVVADLVQRRLHLARSRRSKGRRNSAAVATGGPFFLITEALSDRPSASGVPARIYGLGTVIL
jgi:hypothetical protein